MLGDYTNLVDTAIVGTENFGLDDYEPNFFIPIDSWVAVDYTVKLRFNDDTFLNDFFLFLSYS
jgi:hypothetical protein